MDGIRSRDNVVYRCTYEVVWCPKYRRPVIDGPVQERLDQIIKEVCAERDAPIIELETKPDQVRLHVGCDPRFGIHRLVKQIKGRSSNLLRQEFPALRSRLPTLWTNAYFVATVGDDTTSEAIERYVENQKNA
ncbi:IS200/IS605 family transposase [Nocardia rhizosphaerihabitans]|uniref:IS200/IS605 family transposase n=1 Tax=Nocardia rhizosphaerihabitans TaxID=1691570 RepID=UPI00366CDDFD